MSKRSRTNELDYANMLQSNGCNAESAKGHSRLVSMNTSKFDRSDLYSSIKREAAETRSVKKAHLSQMAQNYLFRYGRSPEFGPMYPTDNLRAQACSSPSLPTCSRSGKQRKPSNLQMTPLLSQYVYPRCLGDQPLNVHAAMDLGQARD